MCAKIRKQEALDFHEAPPRGKIEVIPTKPLRSQHDLALAYSPGVAVPCLEIANNKQDVYLFFLEKSKYRIYLKPKENKVW